MAANKKILHDGGRHNEVDGISSAPDTTQMDGVGQFVSPLPKMLTSRVVGTHLISATKKL